jgi:predicted dinucleotide-binding enzyme
LSAPAETGGASGAAWATWPTSPTDPTDPTVETNARRLTVRRIGGILLQPQPQPQPQPPPQPPRAIRGRVTGMKKIAVLGSGVVGQTLADGFLHHGYEVVRGTREPAKLGEWKEKAGAKASVGTFAEAAKAGEIVVLAVKGTGAEEAVALAGASALAGKTVLDTTNPIADAPPQDAVLTYFTGPNESLMERLQLKVPDAHFVKAFSCVGSVLMVNPTLDTKPTMFICGNDSGAKAEARVILDQFGWEIEDLGGAAAARAIEPLCILWCIPGFLRNDWRHALKMLR